MAGAGGAVEGVDGSVFIGGQGEAEQVEILPLTVGIGLLNVKAVVDKYGGDMVLSCDENEFKAVVIL